MEKKPKVLFLSTGNSTRSQINKKQSLSKPSPDMIFPSSIAIDELSSNIFLPIVSFVSVDHRSADC
jgi:hypothetical protein